MTSISRSSSLRGGRPTLLALLLALGLPLLLGSCGASKRSAERQPLETQSADRYPTSLERLQRERSSWQGIKGSIRGEITSRDKRFSSRLNLLALRGQGIRLSVVPFPLVEAARVWFTPEGVTLVDLINGRYAQESYLTFSQYLGLEITYAQVEALLLGQVFVPGQTDSSMRALRALSYRPEADGTATLEGLFGAYGYTFELSTEGDLTAFVVRRQADAHRLLEANYIERQRLSTETSLPQRTEFRLYREHETSTQETVAQLTLDWIKMQEATEQDRPQIEPRIKEHYQRIRLEQILKMIADR